MKRACELSCFIEKSKIVRRKFTNNFIYHYIELNLHCQEFFELSFKYLTARSGMSRTTKTLLSLVVNSLSG